MTDAKTYDLCRTLAKIRPGMSRASLADVMVTGNNNPAIADTYQKWGKLAQVYFDQTGQVHKVTYLAEFPATITIDHLSIGMLAEDALARFPALRLTQCNKTRIEEYDHGVSTEGFDLSLRIRDGKVLAFDLSRAGAAAERAQRAAENAHRVAEYQRVRQLAQKWKAVEDTDEMLDIWAANVDPAHLDPKLTIAFVTWLKAGSPDDWHHTAMHWNWDNDIAPLLWIIRQPDCDLATAVEIYYLADPYHYFSPKSDRAPEDRGEYYALIMEIRERVASGQFRRRELAFDSTGYFSEPITRISDDPKFPDALPGRTVNDNRYSYP